jgi:hypothetical protein
MNNHWPDAPAPARSVWETNNLLAMLTANVLVVGNKLADDASYNEIELARVVSIHGG